MALKPLIPFSPIKAQGIERYHCMNRAGLLILSKDGVSDFWEVKKVFDCAVFVFKALFLVKEHRSFPRGRPA